MIILIRHCKPNIDYTSCDHLEAARRVDEYNITEDIKTDEILPLLEYANPILKNKNSVIFSSTRSRSSITAKKFFEEREQDIIFDSKFIEFDLNVVPLPFIKLQFGTWATISRILWFLRLLKTKRSVSYEMNRAKECAEILYETAKNGAPVTLVTHGLINNFIEKQLKSKGYSRVSKIENGFFSITELRA